MFSTATEWQSFVSNLGIHPGVPEIVAMKFRRAQMLYFLAWIYYDLIKAGELVGLTTLELALKDRYGNKGKKSKKSDGRKDKKRKDKKCDERILFADLLNCMVRDDGLTDDKIPMVRRYGGSVIGFLTGDSKPSLAAIRNSLAHGDPFDGFPYAGMLELIRDLIEYAYRDMIRPT